MPYPHPRHHLDYAASDCLWDSLKSHKMASTSLYCLLLNIHSVFQPSYIADSSIQLAFACCYLTLSLCWYVPPPPLWIAFSPFCPKNAMTQLPLTLWRLPCIFTVKSSHLSLLLFHHLPCHQFSWLIPCIRFMVLPRKVPWLLHLWVPRMLGSISLHASYLPRQLRNGKW